MRKKEKSLSKEDRILWGQVAKTVDAFPGRMESVFLDETDAPPTSPAPRRQKNINKAKTATPPKVSKTTGTASLQQPLNPIDKPVYRKLARGRVNLDARIDLHGLTQTAAHNLLYGFLVSAHQRGLRHVLVITGKGASRGSEGILRRAVPQWLSSVEFRGLASGCEPAARGHGGDGALYVRLKKRSHEL